MSAAVASIIGCDIHPLHNFSMHNLLRQWGHDEAQVLEWIGHWISQGLGAVEQLIGDADFVLVNSRAGGSFTDSAVVCGGALQGAVDGVSAHWPGGGIGGAASGVYQAHPANQPDTP